MSAEEAESAEFFNTEITEIGEWPTTVGTLGRVGAGALRRRPRVARSGSRESRDHERHTTLGAFVIAASSRSGRPPGLHRSGTECGEFAP